MSETHSTPSEKLGRNARISHEELLRRLAYNPESGEFIWRDCPSHPELVGKAAGYVRPKDGIVIRLDGVRYRAARLAWFYMTGSWPYDVVDHINGDTLDNRWSNLRSVDGSINAQNRRSSKRGKLAPIGAYLHKKSGKYQASMTLTLLGQKRSIYLGLYDTEEQAHMAYMEAKRMLQDGATL